LAQHHFWYDNSEGVDSCCAFISLLYMVVWRDLLYFSILVISLLFVQRNSMKHGMELLDLRTHRLIVLLYTSFGLLSNCRPTQPIGLNTRYHIIMAMLSYTDPTFQTKNKHNNASPNFRNLGTVKIFCPNPRTKSPPLAEIYTHLTGQLPVATKLMRSIFQL